VLVARRFIGSKVGDGRISVKPGDLGYYSPMNGLTDCHAHMADDRFDADRAAVLEKAKSAGIERIITVGETLAEAEQILELSKEYEELLPCAGLYPTFLDLDEAEKTEQFIREHRDLLAGIGEVGLDHWKVKEDADRELQLEIFERFIRLSLELDLPLNVHSRSTGKHVIATLLGEGAQRVQLHAYGGKVSSALPALDAGYFFSIPASIVRSRQKQKLVKRLPLSCLLLETDSPVLGPEPGERNEPANLLIALKTIAEIKEVSEEEVAEAVSENAGQLYGPD
jgi:TatD DNase family protein